MIEISGLTKTFGAVHAVDDLSFTRPAPGRVTGFLGPNGAGKTTTLRCLLGLVAPTAGTATFDGTPYADLADPAAHRGRRARGDRLPPGPDRARPPAGAVRRGRAARRARWTRRWTRSA